MQSLYENDHVTNGALKKYQQLFQFASFIQYYKYYLAAITEKNV